MIRALTLTSLALSLGLLTACETQAPAPVVMSDGATADTPDRDARQPVETAAAPDGPSATAGSRSAAAGSSAPVARVQAASLSSPVSTGESREDEGDYRVVRGDTVYGIAREHDLDIRDLIRENDLRPPYLLAVGQSLKFPPPRRHEVQRGETLYGISRRYEVSMRELARANRLEPPYTLAVGRKLEIPAGAERGGDVAAAPERPAPERATVPAKPAPTDPGPAASEKIRTAQAPRPGDHPRRGQNATPAKSAPARPAEQERKTPVVAAAKPEASPAAAVRKASAIVPPRPPVSKPAKAAVRGVPKPPARTGRGFAWPLQGKVVSRYGPKPGGLFNDGVNIAAERGTPVRAAENGVVAYVGNELRGFGNLVLLRHADGWITAYAHTEVVLVKVGQTVKRGDVVASVGSSGGVDTPQLHFEIRKGRAAVNPAKHLKDFAS